MEVPVFIFTGFLESGKTTFILDNLQDEEFSADNTTLVIACEEGETEYDTAELEEYGGSVVYVGREEELTAEFLAACDMEYLPTQVMIEYNGMWKMDTLRELLLPKGWVLAQVFTTVEAKSFFNYMENMRSVMAEQMKEADVVIFNRCDGSQDKARMRRIVKSVNRRANLIFESEDGGVEESIEELLPFDISQEHIRIEDDDYGIWYMDAMDHPERYAGKTVEFRGIVCRMEDMAQDFFVPGRFAMTCCEDDISFFGFPCQCERAFSLRNRDWITIKAQARCEERAEYEGNLGLVLYAEEIEAAECPQEDLVYFT